jgi:hypothetical protein
VPPLGPGFLAACSPRGALDSRPPAAPFIVCSVAAGIDASQVLWCILRLPWLTAGYSIFPVQQLACIFRALAGRHCASLLLLLLTRECCCSLVLFFSGYGLWCFTELMLFSTAQDAAYSLFFLSTTGHFSL